MVKDCPTVLQKFREVLHIPEEPSDLTSESTFDQLQSTTWERELLQSVIRAKDQYPQYIQERLGALIVLADSERAKTTTYRDLFTHELVDISGTLSTRLRDQSSRKQEQKEKPQIVAREFIRYYPTNGGLHASNTVRFVSPLSESDPPDFDISYGHLNDEDVTYYLRHAKHLRKILVRDNELTDECLSRILGNAGRLVTEIDLSGNPALTWRSVSVIGTSICLERRGFSRRHGINISTDKTSSFVSDRYPSYGYRTGAPN
jgi:hypothetical protein